ncbi:major intrinsic protein [Streptomyces sp. TLI_185]|nr:major intrinsic protein [Streptomyces sp. TLI_185]
MSASLGRRALAEAVGSAALVAVVVGSGIQATGLSRDAGVQLLANSLATVFGLGVLIVLLGPVSGAHFNPVVTLAAWLTDRRADDGLKARDVAA